MTTGRLIRPTLFLFSLVLPPVVSATYAENDLPRVLLMGDSIRLGYAPKVAKLLAGKAEVISHKANGGDTDNTLANLDAWAMDVQPDVIHFNCGLHDLKLHKDSGKHQIPPKEYRNNLQTIVEKLQTGTDASLVFALTTPIHDERHANRGANFDRTEKAVQNYNEIALEVMRETEVPVHDLHWVVEQGGKEVLLGDDGTHYTTAANDRLAEAVADVILRQLIERSGPAEFVPSGPDPEAAAKYWRDQKSRDAAVPQAYRHLKLGQFQPPQDAAEWNKERPEIRRQVMASLGDLPPRPEKPRVRRIARELRDGYMLEKLAIDNGFDEEITALLLVPENVQAPAPAIMWLHSSTPDKSQVIVPNTNGGQEPLGEVWVRKGYVVLSPDTYWKGDRAGKGPAGNYELGVKEEESLAKLNTWLGRTLWGMMVRDDQIALDYLCSRSEVDPARIGVTGMSLGSTRAWWLAAVDERIAATVGVACLSRYANLIKHGQMLSHGPYLFVSGLLKHFDIEGVIALIAPRPYLALTGDVDSGSPLDGIEVVDEQVSQVYDALDAKEKFESIVYKDLGHKYTPEMRREMLDWFDRWLQPSSQQ